MDSLSQRSVSIFKMVTVEKCLTKFLLCHVFKVKSGMTPEYLREHFNRVHNLRTYCRRLRVTSCHHTDYPSRLIFRDSGCFCFPTMKDTEKKSFAYRGCVLWNYLPQQLLTVTGN